MDHSAEEMSQTQPLGLESDAVRSGKVVIVDDEVALGRMICDFLNEIEGLEAVVFDNAEDTTAYLRANTVDMLLTDLCIGEQSGVDMLDVALDANPDTMVILMTAYPTAKTAISVLQKGGYDYLVKPFKLERLRAVVFRGLEAQRMRRENIRLREELGLLKVSSALLSDLNVEETLNMVLEAALRDMGARGVGFAFDSGNPRIDGIEARVMEDEDQEALFFLTDSRSAIFGSHPSQRGPVKQRGSSAAGHRTYIGFPLRSGEKFFGSLNAYFNRECHDAELRMLELLSSSASAAISRAMLHERLSDSYMQALKALAGAIEARDRYTAGHTDRVSQMSELIARDLGWSDAQILELRQGCTLHDIGKIGVPDAILNKTGPLSDYEMNIMRKHPEMGVHIITGIDFLKTAIPYVLFHHERFDGQGYPMRLQGMEIPIQGRILAVADTFDAIVSDRPYRRGRSPEVAVQELKDHRGSQFDPEIVDIFLKVYDENRTLIAKLYGNLRSSKNLRELINEF